MQPHVRVNLKISTISSSPTHINIFGQVGRNIYTSSQNSKINCSLAFQLLSVVKNIYKNQTASNQTV